MRTSGFVVPEVVVDRTVAELPQFQENGRFSPTRYRALDNSARLNLWRQVQESLVVQTYISDMNSLKSSSNEGSFIAAMSSPMRSFDIAIFPFSSFPDSELASYAEANPALFTVTRLSRISISSSERDARQVLDQIRSGVTTFEEAARANSVDWAADRGGDMGVTMAFELEFEIRNEQDRQRIINLARGEISDIVATSSGWSFYRADEASQPADMNDFVQVDRIRNYIMTYLRGRVEDWLVSEAEWFITMARGSSFSEAAEAMDIRTNNFGPIPLNYGDTVLFSTVSSAGVSELSGAGQSTLFWRAAFRTPLNTISEPVILGEYVVVLLPLEEVASDENENDFIQSYFNYLVGTSTENGYRGYFLENAKLDDRFYDMFWKLWDPSFFGY